MRLFIAYGFHERDHWIAQHIPVLAEAFDLETVDGREVYGKPLSEAVKDKIKQSDALIGFTTRRDQQGNIWTTHAWVRDELATAGALGMPIVEVRESGVDAQSGMYADHQHIDYDASRRDECIVQIASALAELRRRAPLKLKLHPQQLVSDVGPDHGQAVCTCEVLDSGSGETRSFNRPLVPITGGLYVYLRNIAPGTFLRVSVTTAGGARWISDFQVADEPRVDLVRR